MASDQGGKPGDKPGKPGSIKAPGGLLAEQSFAEDRDEVEGGTKGSRPQAGNPHSDQAGAKDKGGKKSG